MIFKHRASHSVAEERGFGEMDTVVTLPVGESEVIEKLRGQLLAALSLLMSLGFDAIDLRDLFLT